jgi:hypothetical protein
VSTVSEIQRAIVELSSEEKKALAHWFDELMEDAWDAQIEADAKAGRLDHLWQRALEDIKAGRVKPLDAVINDA